MFEIVAIVLAIAIAIVLILGQTGYLQRPARDHGQGTGGNDLPVDQRLSSMGNLVALRNQGSRDEAQL